jgi:hypothetical protein
MRGIAKMVFPLFPTILSNPESFYTVLTIRAVVHTVVYQYTLAAVGVRLALWMLDPDPAAVVFCSYSQRPQLQSSAGAFTVVVVVVVVVVLAAAGAVVIPAVTILAAVRNWISCDRCSGGLLYTVTVVLLLLGV